VLKSGRDVSIAPYLLFDLIRYFFIVKNEVSRRCKEIKPIKILKKSIPLIDWLFSYDWKNNIIGDIVAGITVAVMHIPQGAMQWLKHKLRD